MQDLESMFLSMETTENMQQEWEDVEGYLTVPYSDDNIVYINNKEVGDISANIVIVNESYSQYVQFENPRYEDGVDLITKRIYVHWEQGDGYTGDNVEAVNVKYSDDYIRFGFVVPASALTTDEEIRIMPFATGEHNGNNYVLKTLYGVLYPQMSLGTTTGVVKPNEEWFLTFERKMSSYVEQGTQLLNETKQSEEQTRAIKTFMDDSIFAMAIVNEESGELIQTKDAANMALYEMSVFGKSVQQKTTGAQLFDCGTVTMNHRINTSNGQIEHIDGAQDASDYIAVVPGNVYTLNFSYASSGNYGMAFYDSDKNFVSGIKQGSVSSITVPFMFTIPDNIAYLRFSTYGEILSSDVMLNAGDSPQPWEPYTGNKPSPNPEYPQEIESVGDSGSIVVKAFGANLLLKDTTAMTFVTGDDINANSVQLPIGKVGDVFREGAYLSFDSDVDIPFELTVQIYEPVGTHWGDSNKITVMKGFNEFVLSGFVPNNSKNIMLLQIRASSSPTSDVSSNFSNMILKAGQEPAEYEPHTEQSFTISTPNGLPGIPVDFDGNYTDSDGQQYIADEIRINADGTGKWVHNVGVQVLNGGEDEDWDIRKTDTDGVWRYNSKIIISTVMLPKTYSHLIPMLCNQNKNITAANTYHCNNGIAIAIDGSVYVYSESFNTSDVILWTAHLAENPMTVYYQLAEPYETDLSAEEVESFLSLRMNKLHNTVFNDANAYQRIKYIADPKTYINNKIEEAIKTITEPV